MPRHSLLERGVMRLASGLFSAARVTIEVRAGGEAIQGLDAAPGRTDVLSMAMGDYSGSSVDMDWIVAADALRFPHAGKQAPTRDWQIRHRREDGLVAVFDVAPGPGSDRAYEPVDQLGMLYRVHSSLNRIEAPA